MPARRPVTPGGLIDGQRRPKQLRLGAALEWYVAAAGRFERVGSGDVSEADLVAVAAELGEAAVFVCVAKPKAIESYLARPSLGTSRIGRRSRLRDRPLPPVSPKPRWVARGARLAVVPGHGTVWVDDEHLFKAGERVPLPWTDPPVELVVVRPATVYAAMKAAMGPHAPKRAERLG